MRDRDWRAEAWCKICPPLFQDTIASRLPAEQLAKVMSWQYGPRGLILVGPPRTGKTRSVWLLLQRLYVEQGYTVKAYSGTHWAVEVMSRYGEPSSLRRWYEMLVTVDVLFLDDPFKVRMTEAQELALWSVFDERSAYCKPILLTCNTDGNTLKMRMTESGAVERADALISRIREFCEPVSFRDVKPAIESNES